MTEYKRKIFLTHVRYQLKYTGYIITGMIAVAIVISFITFSLIYPLLSARLSDAVTETISNDLAKGLLVSYWLSVTVLILAAMIFGLLFSHRVVGPLNRMTAILKDIETGDLSKRIILREKDEFLPLADALNAVLNDFAKSIKGLREDMDLLVNEIEVLEGELKQQNALSGEIVGRLQGILSHRRQLLRFLKKYKT